MIQLLEIKPCAEHKGKFQLAGVVSRDFFSLNEFESLMKEIDFNVFRLGDPSALICKRSDCLFMIDSEGNFTLSEVESQQKALIIIDQIKSGEK